MYQAWRRYHHGILQSGPGFIVPDAAPPPSFPQTSILDNFNRANEGPPPSINWTTGLDGSAGGFSVDANEAEGLNGVVSSAWWNVQNFGPDIEVYATIGSVKGATRLHFRAQQEGTSTWDGYTLLAYTPTNELFVYRVDNGVQTQLGVAIAQTISSGDSFGAKMVGSTITVYYKIGAGSWTEVGTRTDGTYTGAGKLAMSTFDATPINVDNFGGGTI